jgi:hypothetical protein
MDKTAKLSEYIFEMSANRIPAPMLLVAKSLVGL